MAEETQSNDLTILTAEIVANYVSHNSVQMDNIGEVIASVHQALASAGQSQSTPAEDHTKDKAAIRKSMADDYLTSFIDGRKYKSLKRHLTTHGTTPDEYRTKFGLPKDYPMVAPAYSAQRSELAKSLGLGRKAGETKAAPAKVPAKGRSKAIKASDETFS